MHINVFTVNNDDCNLPEKLAMTLSSRPVSAMTLLNNTPDSMSSSGVDVEAKGADMVVAEEWKPTRNEWLIMISLAFISFVVSLDATILVTVLPVSASLSPAWITSDIPTGDCSQAQRHVGRGFLGRNIIPPHFCHLAAYHRVLQPGIRSSTASPSVVALLHYGHCTMCNVSRFHQDAQWESHPGHWWWWHRHIDASYLL